MASRCDHGTLPKNQNQKTVDDPLPCQGYGAVYSRHQLSANFALRLMIRPESSQDSAPQRRFTYALQ
jgi:hypothetical protein